MTKPCTKCGQVKPMEDFYAAPTCRDGRRGDCKDCNRAKARRRHNEDPERESAKNRRWREANAEQHKANWQAYRTTNLDRDRERFRGEAGRRRVLRSLYGMTPEAYADLLDGQGGGCAICKGSVPGAGWNNFAVDHDHACCPGRKTCGNCVRGLLCAGCNIQLGIFERRGSEFAAYLGKQALAA